MRAREGNGRLTSYNHQPKEPQMLGRPPYWVVVYRTLIDTRWFEFTHLEDFPSRDRATRLRDEMIAQGRLPREVWIESRYRS